jgi:hypothetical protein
VQGASEEPDDGTSIAVSREMRRGRWYDLLTSATMTRSWQLTSEGLSPLQTRQNQHIKIPAEMTGSYRMHAAFTRRTGEASVNFVFPVKESVGILYLDVGADAASTLGRASGSTQGGFAQRDDGNLETLRRYNLMLDVEIAVGEAKLNVRLDGEQYQRWAGGIAGLDTTHRTGRFSLGSYDGDTVFHELHVQPLAGEARLTHMPQGYRNVDELGVPEWVVTKRPIGTLRAGESVNLFSVVDLSDDAVLSKWSLTDGRLVSSADKEPKLLVAPLLVEGGYELSLVFRPNSHMALFLPAGASNIRLGMHTAIQGVSGLDLLNGKGLRSTDNPTRVPGTFARHLDKRTTMVVSVRPAGEEVSIRVLVNGEPLFDDWRGPQSALEARMVWRLPRAALFVWVAPTGQWDIEEATLTMLSGQAHLMRAPRTESPAATP